MKPAPRSRGAVRFLAPSGVLVGGLVLGLTLSGCSAAGSADAPSEAQIGSGDTSAASADNTAGQENTDSTDASGESGATATDPAAMCVQSALAAMSPAEQAGQLVMTGTELTDADAVADLVRRNHLGSVFLHGRSSRSAAGLKKEINRLPAVSAGPATIEPLVSIDQEGGAVQSLRGGSWGELAKASEQGTWSARKLAKVTTSWAEDLAAAGISMDLAPVADTVPSGTESQNPPIGVYGREYGTRATAVAEAVATVTEAVTDAGVVATLKHFPGLGRVSANTDTTADVVDSRTTTHDAYLKPFAAGIKAGAGAVMISSATYTRIDPDHRAVFSSAVITDLLRDQMGYQGVVMTDDVGAAEAVADVAPGQRAVRFVRAGGDLVLTIDPTLARTMMTALAHKARQNDRFAALLEAAVGRVLTLKQEFGLLTCKD